LRVDQALAIQKERGKISNKTFTPESRQQTLEDHLANIAAAINTTAESAHIQS